MTIEFNRITFGLPIETFRIDAYIALDERLPVVTEFVLRLLHICGRVSINAFKDYFGFTDSESLSVIDGLIKQGLIELVEDDIQLSLFAIERFEESGGDYPRFNKVELKHHTLTFDLISFTPLRTINGEFPSDNIIKLDAPEDALGESIERAKSAYRQRYAEVAFLYDGLREKSFGVHSIEDIESKRRGYLPIPVSFLLDDNIHVERKITEEFERMASPELLQFVNEKITESIPKTISSISPCLEEFIEIFDLKLMGQYLTGKKFDLAQYIQDIHFLKKHKYPQGVNAFCGNIYLNENLERISTKLNDRREGRHRYGKLLTSLVWLTPDNILWGRGDSFSHAIIEISKSIKSDKTDDNLFILTNSERGQEIDVSNRFRVPRLKELHFLRPNINTSTLIKSGRLELMLYPTGFVVALYHFSIPSSNGILIPIGIISSLPKHLAVAHKLIRSSLSGRGYGGKSSTQRGHNQTLQDIEEVFTFLNYSDI